MAGFPVSAGGVEPAHVDVGRRLDVGVAQVQVGHVLEARVSVPRTDGLHARRLAAEDVVDDGDVVWSEVPDDVDVALVQPEVQPRRVDVVDPSEVTVLELLLELVDR
jgi:hypothetical protein